MHERTLRFVDLSVICSLALGFTFAARDGETAHAQIGPQSPALSGQQTDGSNGGISASGTLSCEDLPPPSAREPAGPPPAALIAARKLHAPPALTGTNDPRAAVERFLEWAAGSFVEEREDGRKLLAAAAKDDAVARAFVEAAERAVRKDHAKALLALSALGELRHPIALFYLGTFAQRPLPNEGPVSNGEISARTAAAMLQAKAVDGLAYSGDDHAKLIVLTTIARHPSEIVRAEAVRAILFNDPKRGPELASRYVRPEERALLDRVEHVLPGDEAGSFNARLERFIARNPKLVPPPPRRLLSCERGDEPVPSLEGGEAPPIP